MNAALRNLFFLPDRRKHSLDIEQTPDLYRDLVQETLERCGVAWDSLIVEIQSVGLSVDRKKVYVAMIYLARWERNSALRLLMGLPLIEAKVREAARTSWLAGHSHFIGLWVHASARLQFPVELRHLIQELTPSGSADTPARDPPVEEVTLDCTLPTLDSNPGRNGDLWVPSSQIQKRSKPQMTLFQTLFEKFPLRRLQRPAQLLHGPYDNEDANRVYNLLFCDAPQVFEIKEGVTPTEWQRAMYLQPNTKLLEQFALNVKEDARIRFHIFRFLRAMDVYLPYKLLLGVVVENHLKGGLDTIAVYADGRIRRIAPHGVSFLIEEPDGLEEVVNEVCEEAQTLAYLVLPSEEARLKPPAVGRMRISALISQGTYTVEGRVEDMLTNNWTAKLIKTSQHLASGLDCYSS
jgi:hypothetical protein